MMSPPSQPGGSSSSSSSSEFNLNPDLQGIADMLKLISDRYRTLIRPSPSQTPSSSQGSNSNYDYNRVAAMIDNAKRKIEKLHQKYTSSEVATRLRQSEAKCEELRMKVICVESELGLCLEEIERLKVGIEGERKGRQEAELKLTGCIQKFENLIEELRDRNIKLEERINTLEMRSSPPEPPPTPSTSEKIGSKDNLTTLDSLPLSHEIQTKFAECNKKQLKLEEELGEIKELVGNMSRTQNVASATENANETIPSPSENQLPPSSPILDVDASAPFLVKVEAVTNNEESTIVDSFSQSPPPTPTEAAAPPIEDSVLVEPSNNAQSFEEEYELSPSLLAPVPVVNEVEDINTFINGLIDIPPFTSLNSTHTLSKRKAKWYMEHRKEQSLKFICVCDPSFEFKSEQNLDKHIKLYTKRHCFACEICFDVESNCHRTFRYLSELRKHLKDIHDALLESNQVIGCPTCGDRLSSWSEFKTHLKKCRRKVSSSSPDGAANTNLAQDQSGPVKVIIHGKASEVNCEGSYSALCYCGKKFDSLDAILEHIKYYTAECKWKCDLQRCGRKFRENEELLEHRRNVHKMQSVLKFFSQNVPVGQNQNLNREEPTSSTDLPGTSASLTQPVTQPTTPTTEGKRTALELQSESGQQGPSFSAKRSRLNYPVRRASKGTERPSSSNNPLEK